MVTRLDAFSKAPRPCACSTVRRASRLLVKAFDSILAGDGINVTQLALLRAIQRHTGEPLVRVAEDLCMDRSSLYRNLAPLKKSGWITIAPGPDGRSRRARVTASGQRAVNRCGRNWAKIQTEIVERFGRDEWPAFIADLQRLADCATGAANIPQRKLT